MTTTIDPGLTLEEVRDLARRFEVERDTLLARHRQRDDDDALTIASHERQVAELVAAGEKCAREGNAVVDGLRAELATLREHHAADHAAFEAARPVLTEAQARAMVEKAWVDGVDDTVDETCDRFTALLMRVAGPVTDGEAVPSTPSPGGHDGPNEDAAAFFEDSPPASITSRAVDPEDPDGGCGMARAAVAAVAAMSKAAEKCGAVDGGVRCERRAGHEAWHTNGTGRWLSRP